MYLIQSYNKIFKNAHKKLTKEYAIDICLTNTQEDFLDVSK